MRFSRGFFFAVLLVLAPVTVLCGDGDGNNAGVLPMSSVTYDKDIPSDKASSSDPMANGTAVGESATATQSSKLQPQQESTLNTSDGNSTSDDVSSDAPVSSTGNASVSAASTARDAIHDVPTGPAVTEPPQTSPPTVQTSSPENTTVSASSSASQKPSPEAFSSQDAATQTTSNAAAKQTSSSSVTTPRIGSSTVSSNSAAQTASPSDPGTTTPSSSTHEATTPSQSSSAETKAHVTENALLNRTPAKLQVTPTSSASPETTVQQAVTLPRPQKRANSSSTALPNRPILDLAALTNISEGEEVSITIIPEREEYAEVKNDSSASRGTAPADRPSVESEVTVSDAEKTTVTISPVTPSSSVLSNASLSTEASDVHAVKAEPSPIVGTEQDKPTNLKTIDFHEYSTKETHQDIRPVLEMAEQIQHPAAPTVEREEEEVEENVTLHAFPAFPINVSGLNSSTSVVVSVSFSDEENQTFMMTKDNVSLPVPTPESSMPSVLQNLVPDVDSNSTLTGPGPTNDSGSSGTGHHISVFRPISSNSSHHRKYSGPTRKTTVAPSHSTAGVVIAKGHASSHHGRAGLNLPTRKTTPGAPGGSTQKPHIGRGGTRAPFGIIGSTRRTTLGTKATIRPLTKIFDRARTRSHTKATTARPGRGMRMRITTGKPVRKGFPIGPKPTLGNESAPFDLDAYTRLLNVTRRPSRPPQPTWRTTFFNVTDPTPGPNEVEAPVIRVAGIAKIVDGWEWSPLLGDHNTHEYRYLAYTTRRLLASVFRRTTEGRYFYRVDIDGFSPGSVIVDYFVLFYQRGGPVDPVELASAFNAQLGTNGSLGEEFFLDPTYTQFEVVGVVRPKPLASSSSAEPPVPQWAIAVIVIATASLIFIVLFGAVTIYGRTAERRKYSSRLQDDDLDNVTSSPSKDWESKLAASYENFAADSVYDTEDLQSPPPRDLLQYDERYRAW